MAAKEDCPPPLALASLVYPLLSEATMKRSPEVRAPTSFSGVEGSSRSGGDVTKAAACVQHVCRDHMLIGFET